MGWSRGSGLLEQSPGAGCSPWGSVKEDTDSLCPHPPRVVLSAGAQRATCRTVCRQHAILKGGQESDPPLQSAGKPP